MKWTGVKVVDRTVVYGSDSDVFGVEITKLFDGSNQNWLWNSGVGQLICSHLHITHFHILWRLCSWNVRIAVVFVHIYSRMNNVHAFTIHQQRNTYFFTELTSRIERLGRWKTAVDFHNWNSGLCSRIDNCALTYTVIITGVFQSTIDIVLMVRKHSRIRNAIFM